MATESTAQEQSTIPNDLQQRYSNWKKNTKLLYDYLNTNATKWPSLTCQFFPDLDTTSDTHRILISSFTSSQLPEDEAIHISKISTLKHLNWASVNNFDMDEMEFKPDTNLKLPSKHLVNDLTIKFPNGDCNRARYLPQNPDVIAAASSNGSVYIFDRTKHGSSRIRQSKNLKPYDAVLFNNSETVEELHENTNEAISLAWNYQKEGTLASCYLQGQVQIWDIKQYFHSNPVLDKPVLNIQFDALGVNDVSWMPSHDSLFVACGESDTLALFDQRIGKEVSRIAQNRHNGGVNSCKFNYQNNMLLASADSEGLVNMWDIRNLDQYPIKSINHGSSISTIEWNPNLDTIIATAGQNDGLVKLWDVSNTDNELLFVHGGHMLGVNDISWDLHDSWLMCSVSNDNSIQIWKPAHNLVEAEQRV
ncbi:Msi1p NDAI_0C05510 [Naumovozyma dairenensis CBS 421]|uniref:Uncharacterized protein n=1 Tax=Naumovozyma dairenensis (strain ATCC 10597 / BCRC 20456 / CBS 421 / NBRC 0211 / NRRL Y-12639) TaxID=1071378 RepID=G0W8U9_NAUDC|nr:hypothetical protein NDAI_0C05510 [Naumovozyma dairenensis CBS 421]CCD24210.1 hypothetical protein NDAI_0C05510 [Naumovozyma dairenensis CBS 421]